MFPLIVIVTTKFVDVTAVPAAVVTAMGPVVVRGAVAVPGTVAVMLVSETTVKLDAGMPLKVTPTAPVRFSPVIVTVVPPGPLPGKNKPMAGRVPVGGVTVKLVALVPVPPMLVTAMGPVVAPEGTTATIVVSESVENIADVPLKVTAKTWVVGGEDPMKLVPVIVTDVPTGPLVGVNEVIVGAEIVSWGTKTLAMPTGLTEVPAGRLGEAKGVNGWRIT